MLEQKLYTFIKLAECESTTQTALELHMTQPAVSQQLKALETEYNIQLFNREGRRIILTNEGRQFYLMLKRMITMEQQFAEMIKQPAVKTIRFGATLSISEGIMPELLPKMINHWKDIRFELTTQNTKELLRELEEGLIDFALIEGNFNQKKYAHSPIMKAKFSGFCQKGSPYKKFKRLEECISAPLIIREKGSGTRTIFESECETYNISVEDFLSSHEVDSIPVILNLVKSGAGITFAYDCAMQEGIKKGEIEEIVLENFSLERDFSFVALPDMLKTEKLFEICDVIKKFI
ncbi:MAG: LysR substrate-binding domain-containing protein [Fusobacterium sp.]|uniref:LysR substrate-binding domain-containing protein n=1 Tax=Fusobacterium sp. SB021 TaxID=2744227 RepID=UPI003A202B15